MFASIHGNGLHILLATKPRFSSKYRTALGARLPQPRSTQTSGSGGRAADRQSRACLSAASLRGGPEVEYCRWSPEGSAAVERQARCGASGYRSASQRAESGHPIGDQSTIYRIRCCASLSGNRDLTPIARPVSTRRRHQTARSVHTVSYHPCMPTSGALWMGRMALML